MGEDNKKYTIFSIDDEHIISEIVKRFLEPKYRVISSTSPNEALEILQTEKVDLILLDLQMPEMDGFEVCKIIKNDDVLKAIPVIFVSAHHNPAEIEEGYKIGCNDFMGKPFIKEELMAKVKIHLKFGELALIESIAGGDI